MTKWFWWNSRKFRYDLDLTSFYTKNRCWTMAKYKDIPHEQKRKFKIHSCRKQYKHEILVHMKKSLNIGLLMTVLFKIVFDAYNTWKSLYFIIGFRPWLYLNFKLLYDHFITECRVSTSKCLAFSCRTYMLPYNDPPQFHENIVKGNLSINPSILISRWIVFQTTFQWELNLLDKEH